MLFTLPAVEPIPKHPGLGGVKMNGRPPFVWFSDEDNEILGQDICSKCHNDIPPEDTPLMLFAERDDKTYIARFHEKCALELMQEGVLRLVEDK